MKRLVLKSAPKRVARRGYTFTVPFFVVGLVAPGIDDGPLGPFKAAGGRWIEYARDKLGIVRSTTLAFSTRKAAQRVEQALLAYYLNLTKKGAERRDPGTDQRVVGFDFDTVVPSTFR